MQCCDQIGCTQPRPRGAEISPGCTQLRPRGAETDPPRPLRSALSPFREAVRRLHAAPPPRSRPGSPRWACQGDSDDPASPTRGAPARRRGRSRSARSTRSARGAEIAHEAQRSSRLHAAPPTRRRDGPASPHEERFVALRRSRPSTTRRLSHRMLWLAAMGSPRRYPCEPNRRSAVSSLAYEAQRLHY
jgi:hypothetical protein